MTLKQILATLAARWFSALAIVLLVAGATAAASLTMFKRYTGSASVMLDARSPEQVAGGVPNSSLPGGYMATQMELINSERVGRAVIAALRSDSDAVFRARWMKEGDGKGDFEAWLSAELQKGLAVKPAPVSNVLDIYYTAADAAEAAKFANAYVKAYFDTSLAIRMERVRQYSGFFDARAKELRADLDAAQSRFSEYQRQNGLVVGDEKLNIEALRLSELSAQLLAAQSASAEVSGRLRQAGRQTDQLQEVWRNPAVAALSADVTREEVRLRELTSRLGDSHPQLVEQEARLAELRSRLAAERGRAVSNVGFDNTASQSRAGQLASQVDAQRTKVLRMQVQREQGMTLQREVDSAQRSYDTVLQRVTQSSLESQNNYTNVTVLKHATAPMLPSSPNVPKNVAAGLAGGLMLALAYVLGREQLDRRLRTEDDIAELKQSMLISLPVSSHARSAVPDTSRTKLMKQRVLTGLPRPSAQQSN